MFLSKECCPLISIIIPVYNVEKFLKKSIDSVINQTYENLEIILVDDGSTDTSGMMCDQYKLLYPDITVIHKENGGLSDARNCGLSVCNGEFVEFVDSDDVIAKNLTSKLYNLIKKNNADISICDYVDFYEQTNEPKFYDSDKSYVLSKIDCLSLLFYQKCSFSACGKLYKKELFKTNTFKKGLLFEDVDLIPKLVLSSESIVYNKSKLYAYLHRQNSITTKKFTKQECVILEIAKEHFYKLKCLPTIVNKATTSYLVTAAFRVFLNTIDNKDLVFENLDAKNIIKKYGKSVFFDKKSRLKNKIGLLLFFMLEKFLFAVYLYTRKKNK